MSATTVEATTTPARPVLAAECGCGRAFLLDEQHHDWLLSFESRGLRGVIQLLDHFEHTAEEDRVAGELPWVDFPQFVAMHFWTNPADVYALADWIDSEMKMRQHLRVPDVHARRRRGRHRRVADEDPAVTTLTYSVTEAAERLGIHRNYAYDLARSGEFPVPVIRIGQRLRVPAKQLDEFCGLQDRVAALEAGCDRIEAKVVEIKSTLLALLRSMEASA